MPELTTHSGGKTARGPRHPYFFGMFPTFAHSFRRLLARRRADVRQPLLGLAALSWPAHRHKSLALFACAAQAALDLRASVLFQNALVAGRTVQDSGLPDS